MDRRTKIVCTLGPATTDPETLRRLVAAGMDVARMNFSHGTHEEHRERVETVREVAEAEGKGITVLQDLQGPKIRVGAVQNDSVMLAEGDEVRVSTDTPRESTNEHIFIDYEALARDAREGERILIDDGLLELRVIETNGSQLRGDGCGRGAAAVSEGGKSARPPGLHAPDDGEGPERP